MRFLVFLHFSPFVLGTTISLCDLGHKKKKSVALARPIFVVLLLQKKTQHKEEEKEEPAPMKELMNVLGTLKKRPKKRDSEHNTTADSA